MPLNCKICGDHLTGQKRSYCSEECQKKGNCLRSIKWAKKNSEKIKQYNEKNKEKFNRKRKSILGRIIEIEDHIHFLYKHMRNHK